LLRRFPMAASEDTEVDPSAARVRKQDRIVRRRKPVKRLDRLGLKRNRPVAQPGFVCFSRPFAYARRT
jgi:hypothetical protein